MHMCINPPKETLFPPSFHPLHSCVPDKEREREARFIRQEAKVGHSGRVTSLRSCLKYKKEVTSTGELLKS